MNPDEPPEDQAPFGGSPPVPDEEDLQRRMFGGLFGPRSPDEERELDEYWRRGIMGRKDEGTREERKAAREEYWRKSGIPKEAFDWDDWRKEMGYDEDEDEEGGGGGDEDGDEDVE
jgi:hypothetical protein